MQQCILCEKWFDYLETHELFCSGKRKESIKLKLQVKICHSCHDKATRKVDSRQVNESIANICKICYNDLHPIMNKVNKYRTHAENKYLKAVSMHMQALWKDRQNRELWL